MELDDNLKTPCYDFSFFTSGPIPWAYDQFDGTVIDVAMEFVNGMKLANRGTIAVARRFSAIVNANDEGGILSGKKNDSMICWGDM